MVAGFQKPLTIWAMSAGFSTKSLQAVQTVRLGWVPAGFSRLCRSSARPTAPARGPIASAEDDWDLNTTPRARKRGIYWSDKVVAERVRCAH